MKSSLKGGTGLGIFKAASDLILQATSSPRKRRLNVAGTHLVKACRVHFTYTSFRELDQRMSCACKLGVRAGWLKQAFHQASDGARGQDLAFGGKVHWAPRHGSLPGPPTSCSLLGVVWPANTDLLPACMAGKGCSCHHCHTIPHRRD